MPSTRGVFQEYLRCYRDPATRHAICEDYRAAATIDLEHDAADADRKVTAPLLALWGAKGVVGQLYDVLATWREKAGDVTRPGARLRARPAGGGAGGDAGRAAAVPDRVIEGTYGGKGSSTPYIVTTALAHDRVAAAVYGPDLIRLESTV